MTIDTAAQAGLDGAVIALVHDVRFDGQDLAELLRDAGHSVIEGSTLDAAGGPERHVRPQLVVMRIEAQDPACLDLIRSLRASPAARAVPILGVTAFEKMSLDLQELRSHGVVGLVDARSPVEYAMQRIAQIVRPSGMRRASERVRCLFPVSVALDGSEESEFALDLSESGLRLTSQQALEENTDLMLRFSLPMVSEETIEVQSRVVRRTSWLNSWGRYEVGVFFYSLEERTAEILRQEVERLLSQCQG